MEYDSPMSFIRSRDELLTDYLREQITTGQMTPPLPSSRDWAKNLGVGCKTLSRSLQTLEREGLIELKPRLGTFLRNQTPRKHPPSVEKILRLVYHGSDYTDFLVRNRWCDLLFFLSQSLKRHGIHLVLEKCTDARLRAIRTLPQPCGHRELLLLRSLSESNQRLFSESSRPSLVFGYRPPEINLPYVNFDLEGAIRHATHRLYRKGCTQVWLLVNQGKAYGVQSQRNAFSAACRTWPRQPVSSEIVSLPARQEALLAVLKRFSFRLQKGHGIIVLAPIIFTTIVSAILRSRGNMLQDLQMISVGGMPDPSSIWPEETHYYISVDSAIKAITHTAVHFFETGVLPKMTKTIPLEISKR